MAAVYRPPEFGDQFPDGCVYCYNNQYNGLTIHTVLSLSGIKIKSESKLDNCPLSEEYFTFS